MFALQSSSNRLPSIKYSDLIKSKRILSNSNQTVYCTYKIIRRTIYFISIISRLILIMRVSLHFLFGYWLTGCYQYVMKYYYSSGVFKMGNLTEALDIRITRESWLSQKLPFSLSRAASCS